MRALLLLALLLPVAAAQEDNRSNVTTTQIVDSCGKVQGAYCTPGPEVALVVAVGGIVASVLPLGTTRAGSRRFS